MAETIRETFERIIDLVPHRHGRGKRGVSLTDPWTAEKFLRSLDSLIADAL